MTKINGENGNRFDIRINLNPKNGKTEKADNTVAITPTKDTKVSDVDLLNASTFIPGVEINKNVNLVLPQINLANVTSADRKEAFHLVDNPLTQAYMYGPIDRESALARMDKLNIFAEDLMLPGDRVGGLKPEDEVHIV